jgi:hypothetical protein
MDDGDRSGGTGDRDNAIILHIRAASRDNIIGQSPITVARGALSLALAHQFTAQSLSSNSLRPSGLLAYPNILEPVNRRGRSRALLPDGTVLVRSSRQAFLDAARVLIAAGYDPDSWLEGWRPGSTAFALRARLGVASGLTVDETRTVFAPWKPFSPSAVSPSIRHPEEAATIPQLPPLQRCCSPRLNNHPE